MTIYDPFHDDGPPPDTVVALKALALGAACVFSGVALSTSMFIAGYRWLERRIAWNG